MILISLKDVVHDQVRRQAHSRLVEWQREMGGFHVYLVRNWATLGH
jgi:hypothetical protein